MGTPSGLDRPEGVSFYPFIKNQELLFDTGAMCYIYGVLLSDQAFGGTF